MTDGPAATGLGLVGSHAGALRERFVPEGGDGGRERKEGAMALHDDDSAISALSASAAAATARSPSDFRNDRAVVPLNVHGREQPPLQDQVWARGESFDLGFSKPGLDGVWGGGAGRGGGGASALVESSPPWLYSRRLYRLSKALTHTRLFSENL